MDIKKYVTKTFIKKISQDIYDGLVYPIAQAYVAKTDNKWDDQALLFLNGMVTDFLEGLDKEEVKEEKAIEKAE